MTRATVPQPLEKRTPDQPRARHHLRQELRLLVQAGTETLLEQLEEFFEEQARPVSPSVASEPQGPLLLETRAAAELLGVSKTRFFELKRLPGFPGPVSDQLGISRDGKRFYRRADLEQWVTSLAPTPKGEARP